MKKHIFIKLTALFICLIMLTGCSGLSSTDKEFKKRSKKLNLSGTTITVMASRDWISNAEQKLGSNFEAATGIHVNYKLLDDNVYLDTLFETLDSEDAPDIFLTQSGFAIDKSYNLDKYAIGLAGESWTFYYDNFSAQEASINGILYGMTYYDTTTDYYIIYNKKLFEKAGINNIPKTFDAFADACAMLRSSGVTPIYEPMADGWHQTMLFAEVGQVFNVLEPGVFDQLNANEITFSEIPCMKQALEQIALLAEKGYMGKNYDTAVFDDAAGYMASGEYAMCMLKPGYIDTILKNDLNNGFEEDDFGIMLLPICDNQLLNVHPTGPSRFIYKQSDNIDAAKLYFEYLTKKDNIQYVINHEASIENLPFLAGQTPKYKDVTTEFLAQYDFSSSGTVLQDKVTYFNEQWGEVSANILKMCKGQMTPDEVLQAIDDKRAELAKNAGDSAW